MVTVPNAIPRLFNARNARQIRRPICKVRASPASRLASQAQWRMQTILLINCARIAFRRVLNARIRRKPAPDARRNPNCFCWGMHVWRHVRKDSLRIVLIARIESARLARIIVRPVQVRRNAQRAFIRMNST